MNKDFLLRTSLLIGDESIELLSRSSVIIFGIGGVGSYIAEALTRSGVGHLALVDGECIDETNINRQLFALHSTIGMPKVEAARQRLTDINPELKLTLYHTTYSDGEILLDGYDYVADAIDSITAKLNLIVNAKKAGIPIISSMGTGNRLDPSAVYAADVYETSGCPLARVMRHELRKRGVDSLRVVASREEAVPHKKESPSGDTKRKIIGSTAFVPSTAGLLIASEIVADLTGLGR